MRFAGLDLSPDGTAITIWDNDNLENVLLFSMVKKWETQFPNYFCTPPKVSRGDERARINRLSEVSEEIIGFLLASDIQYVCLEDYAYGKSNGSQYQIAELGGVVRLGLCKHLKIRTHDPKSLKLFWAGMGTATKFDMVIQAQDSNWGATGEILDFIIRLRQDYNKKYIKKEPSAPTKHPFEGFVDSLALAKLLHMELLFRAGAIQLSEMSESSVRVFNRVTQNIPHCLIDRPFLYLGK